MSIELIEAEWRLYASVNYAIIGSDNGLSPVWWQPIIWTHDGLLSIWPKGTYFIEILLEIQKFSFKKMYLKCRLQKWRPSCPGLNELTHAEVRTFLEKQVNTMAADALANCVARLSAAMFV